MDGHQVDTKDKICKGEKSENLALSCAYKINRDPFVWCLNSHS